MKRVLILGGTGDAIALAAKASQIPNIEIITSLAGRTQTPMAIAGSVRVGGFGGATGLSDYLRDRQIDYLIDATHPFAAEISRNATIATRAVGIPHLMLVRPAWEKMPYDRWIEVESIEAAALALKQSAKRVFLTIGRQQLAPFARLQSVWFLMRSIDPPSSDIALPNGITVLDRAPFTIEQEKKLILDHAIDTIVSKNSGGNATYAKIVAARELEIPIVMVQRSPTPPVGQVADVEGAIDWLLDRLIDML
ncbi:MAG: cobalt-precorrin-6A reductase [Phormidesmis sp. CAN_BIN44]|nr:cobalt-precorrin-6A reductase [Phormidesmis sp. CAN_BIN44]